MKTVHNELQTYQHTREHAHDEYRGGPRSPRNGAEENNETKDGDEERDDG
jgi:hypothetical protein